MWRNEEVPLLTGVPDPSSVPVVGQGLGVRGAVFFNGARTDPLFAYTPNWARLPVAAFATAAEAREFAAKLDGAYALGLRWRRTVDLEIGNNPAKSAFWENRGHAGAAHPESRRRHGQHARGVRCRA